ncbi:hypothetical protein B0H17DRAFT_1203783 [Mycena rosella]|uniref:Uncharacterized protein n=1 Tax=Mycena rosella TaxID=1033263 RepID=A0AAD7DCC4_MYCRO|nr:hypothetical protein B0H17DRAFT_1203783 [Mycena rosella]
MVEAHTALQNQPREPNCLLERVILSLMFWSDSTHLASFGDASLWPLYMFFGNQSKWLRGKPRSNVCHHVAYFPKLPDVFHDWFRALTGKAPPAEVLTHCRRELMHAIWRLLLDDEFLDAYEHGIVIKCADGISRRFYPRIFSYSADYPEKVLLATIRNLGKAPCPRCYLPKEDIPELGTVRDDKKRETLARTDEHIQKGTIRRIRDKIYMLGRVVNSTTFDYYLLARSWTPTFNAFSDRLSKFGFNPFKMLVPDFMHEFELGVFKSFFIHLLRILFAHGGGAISELNTRFRLIPTFGRSTIRRFTLNTSALKKMAAWNYQSILLCAIPVIEDLLPEPYNSEILDILFTLAEWHTLAKLKLHTDATLNLLALANKGVGRLLRRFKRVTCPDFATKELPSEEASRGRAQARKAAKGKGKARARPVKTTPKVKEYSLLTYKLHSLGDYVPTIRWFGTSDSYSTQPGELEHRRVKRFYARTNKNRAVRQMTQLERRETYLLRMANRVHKKTRGRSTAEHQGHMRKLKASKTYIPFAESEALPYTTPDQHHHISPSHNFSLHLSSWLGEHQGDPATDGFLPKLQEHILGRLAHPEWSGDGNEFSAAQRFQTVLKNNRMYRHKILRVNYTGYDVRLGQDCLNPRTHSDVMSLAPEGASHPFSYSQIIGIFHADVVNTAAGANPRPESMEFLWVRRYRLDSSWRGGFKRKRLFRVEFIPDTDPNAFGFLNPDEVIRGAHIVPAFASGRTEDLLASGSVGRLPRDGLTDDEDWRFYYVNFFVDRDIYMRYIGGGVGDYRVKIPADEQPAVVDTGMDEEEEEEDPPPEINAEPPTIRARSSLSQNLEEDVEEVPPVRGDDSPSNSRPGSSLSQNSQALVRSGSSGSSSGSSSSSESGRDDGSDGDEDQDLGQDLGPEDGDGWVDEEVQEGYTPL